MKPLEADAANGRVGDHECQLARGNMTAPAQWEGQSNGACPFSVELEPIDVLDSSRFGWHEVDDQTAAMEKRRSKPWTL